MQHFKSTVEDVPQAEINMAHIRVGGGIAGLIFAIGSVFVFAIGIPSLRMVLAGAVTIGVLVSAFLTMFHKYRPLTAPPAIR